MGIRLHKYSRSTGNWGNVTGDRDRRLLEQFKRKTASSSSYHKLPEDDVSMM